VQISLTNQTQFKHKHTTKKLAVVSIELHIVMSSTYPDVFVRGSVIAPCPPHLRLTTSKVMVIVWRLRGNIIRTVLCTANVLPLQWAQLTKTVHTARLGLEFVFLCFFWG